MCGRGEGAAGDLGEESGCGPDTDSGHTGQDRVKRVSKNSLFYRKRHLVSLLTQRDELECQTWQYYGSGIRAGNDDGLFGQCLSYVCCKAFTQTRRKFAELWAASFFSPSEASFSGEGYRWRRSSTAG